MVARWTLPLIAAAFVLTGTLVTANKTLADEIQVVAEDTDDLKWTSPAGTFADGRLTIPVKAGDVLVFKFDTPAADPHGVRTEAAADLTKVQKRGEAESETAVLKELGEGASRFNVRVNPADGEEITQLEVLPSLNESLQLRCFVHSSMKITLNPAATEPDTPAETGK